MKGTEKNIFTETSTKPNIPESSETKNLRFYIEKISKDQEFKKN